jgi:regulatory protein
MRPGARSFDTTGPGTKRYAAAEKPVGRTVSLRGRALKLLGRRDYSYAELERKLAPHAADAGELSGLLEDLQRLGWLSEQRLAEQLVRKHSARYGARKIVEQLQARGIDPALAGELRGQLEASELQRARAVWARRFGRPPADPRERGRQARFLEQRGFDPDVIRRLLPGAPEE